MIDYKVIPKKNPRKPDEPMKYYATPIRRELIGTEQLCKEAALNTTVSAGEMYNAFENLMNVIPRMLLAGNSVKLGKLGTLRVSFGSAGADTEKAFKSELIKEPKVVFTASEELREQIRKEARFNKQSSKSLSGGDEEESGEDSEL